LDCPLSSFSFTQIAGPSLYLSVREHLPLAANLEVVHLSEEVSQIRILVSVNLELGRDREDKAFVRPKVSLDVQPENVVDKGTEDLVFLGLY
jgi:hypothetical protein